MPSITVTITTTASGPFQLSKLLDGNTYGGAVTVAPASPAKVPAKVNYLSVQSDPANGSNFAVVGDSSITTSAGGKRLAAGVTDVMQGPSTAKLAERYVQASTAGVIVNIEVY